MKVPLGKSYRRNAIVIQFIILLLIPIAAFASEIKISSFNVNFNNDKLKETFALIKKFDPDIILLQESTVRFKKGAKDHLPDSYKFSWFVEDEHESGGGFAVISKLPLAEKKYIEKSTGAFGAQKFRVKLGQARIHFVNIHLNPAPLPRPFNRAGALHAMMMNNRTQVLEIRNILKQCKESHPTVIAGDLNSFPGRPAYRQLSSRGFTDAHLSYDANATSVSTWKMIVDGAPLQGRFDYVFHSKSFETKKLAVEENDYSDHALLNCTLKLNE
ncbi:MAG: endonuclease/exonuclease/phosphatase family protein [Verrucomicrobiia bacterium]|jgi:endonuclease/exonuclease/phosphatase family metal-dependent hydrolase